MFDDYLRQRAAANGDEFRAFDIRDDYDRYVDGKPRGDGVRSFLQSRGIDLPEGAPDDPPERRDDRGARKPQERDRAAADRRAGRRAVRGLGALRARPRSTPGCAGRSSRRAPTAAPSCRPPGSRTSSRRSSTATSPSGSTSPASRRPTPTSPAPASSASSPRRRRCSRTRWPGSRRAARATSASWSAWIASARPTALREHGARRRRRGPGGAARLIRHGSTTSRPGRSASARLDLDVLAQSESVFALSNGHIGLRGNLDEGEPYGLPGTYLNGFYETHAAALRRGRLRLPGVGPDAWSTRPTARSSGCWSPTSPSTSATGTWAATSARSTCAPAP